MRIVVAGGTGLTGRRLVATLRRRGHEAVSVSRSSGVDSFTGRGLADAVAGADVVVDVTSPPSGDGRGALSFFETSTRNLLEAGHATGVRHHIVLSIVGLERLLAGEYFRAKFAQEALVRQSSVPCTIARATQFYEFVAGIADAATYGRTIRLPPALMQPIAADDVAAILASFAVGEPSNTTVDLAGPDRIRQPDLVRQFLEAGGDVREVVTDPRALYFGVALTDTSLVPDGDCHVGPTRFTDWLARAPR